MYTLKEKGVFRFIIIHLNLFIVDVNSRFFKTFQFNTLIFFNNQVFLSSN
jgi:hypothetical protein